MMKTATSPAVVPRFSPEGTSPSTDSPPRETRIHPCTYFDVFNPPLDVNSSAVSTGSPPTTVPSSPASIPGLTPVLATEVTCSPATLPNSFHYPSTTHTQEMASPKEIPNSPPQGSPSLNFSRLPTSPALNFRKTRNSVSFSRDQIEDLHLGESLHSPGSGGSSGILHHHHHHPHYHQQSCHSPLGSSFTPRRQMSTSDVGLTQDDLDATATAEEVNSPELLSKYISNHVPSPSTPIRKGSLVLESFAENLPPVVPIEETTISSSIPLYEMPADFLLPLVDRPNDVNNLVNHPCRARFIQILKNSLGEEIYEEKLLKLWLETDRNKVSDAEWLWKTKSIILQRPGAGSTCRDGKLWGDFCDMVGWDEDDLSIDHAGPAEDRKIGTPADPMEKITEGDEEDDSLASEQKGEKKA